MVALPGRRFTDDATDTLGLAEQVRAQPGHVAYLVFDDRIAAAAGTDPFVEHVILPRAARRGMTVANLAKQLEIDVGEFEVNVDVVAGTLSISNRTNPVDGTHHPHVRSTTEPCWGNLHAGVTRLLAATLPRVEVQEFPELGHMGPVTHPEPVNAAIARFLERV